MIFIIQLSIQENEDSYQIWSALILWMISDELTLMNWFIQSVLPTWKTNKSKFGGLANFSRINF